MLSLVLLSNVRLVIYLFGALVFASMSWLYLDAMAVRPHKSVLARGVGALGIALSFVLGAIQVEGAATPWSGVIQGIATYLLLAGFTILALGVWGEPLSKRPSYNVVFGIVSPLLASLLPLFVGLGYLRRASVGLERHLTSMGYGMYTLALAAIFDLRRLYTSSSDVRVYEIARDYGLAWGVQLVVLLLGLILISRWVFSYLLKRFETQLTLLMGVMVMIVFALATISQTYVMASRLEDGLKREMTAAARVSVNLLARRGLELETQARQLIQLSGSSQEALAKNLKAGERLLDPELRDVVSGEKFEYPLGVGYIFEGEGSAKKLILQAIVPSQVGYAMVQQEVTSEVLSDLRAEHGAGLVISSGGKVVVASAIPGYERLASILHLARGTSSRIGGVEYVVGATVPLTAPDKAVIAQLEALQPMSEVWMVVGQAMARTYQVGVIVLLAMQVPAYLMSRYLKHQLG